VVTTRLFPDGQRREVHVRSLGQKEAPLLLVLHGGHSDSWSRDLRAFFEPAVMMGYRVVAPDLVGFGNSPGVREPAANETRHTAPGGSVEVLEDVLAAFGWRPVAGKEGGEGGGEGKGKASEHTVRPASSSANGRLDLLGFSTGAGVALSFALKHHAGGQGGRGAGRRKPRRGSKGGGEEAGAGAERPVSGGARRIGTLVLVNPVYRSGLNDANLVHMVHMVRT
jgi:pimeloyl-ACP methyl ester carboxylesterase